MNEPIRWDKIAILMLVVLGVAALSFAVGKKSASNITPDYVSVSVPISNQQKPAVVQSNDVSVAPSFEAIDWSKVEFDGCGKKDKYASLPWWASFGKQVEGVPFYNKSYIEAQLYFAQNNEYQNPKHKSFTYDAYCQDTYYGDSGICTEKNKKLSMSDFDEYGEGCLAKDGSAFVAVFPGGYMDGGNHVFRYDIKNNVLEEAEKLSAMVGEPVNVFSPPTEFLQREGTIIRMQGSNGDAGCGQTSYYNFDFVSNTIKQTERCSQCEGEKMKCENL